MSDDAFRRSRRHPASGRPAARRPRVGAVFFGAIFFGVILAGAISAGLFLLAATSALAQAPAKKEEGFQTLAPHAILVDAETGTVLFEKSADQLVPPASLAKLMTAEVAFNAIKEGKAKLEDEFLISENAWRKGGAPSGGSAMFAAIHSRVRVHDLLRGMIIQSGNDAAIALAEGLGGSEFAFADMMTQRARALGLTRSTFTNPTGLHDAGLSVTARELATLSRHIIRTYPDFYGIYAEREFTWNKIRQQNRNPLLTMNLGADGLKTGFTKEAGYNLVGSAVQNETRLIVVVAGLKTAADRAGEARKLLEWGFKAFETRPLFAQEQIIGEAKLFGGEKGRVPLVSRRPVSLLVPKGVSEKIIARIVYQGPVRAPVTKGQPIGKLKVWRGDIVVLEAPLEAGESVGAGGLVQRAFDAASELAIGALRAGFDRL